MSKVSDNKFMMGYREKPIHRMCSNCMNFTSTKTPSEYVNSYLIESELRCTIGEFAVKKTAVCDNHKYKEEA